MKYSDAIRILEGLADGIHPVTGEVLPDDAPTNTPSVIRSLFVAIRAIEARKIIEGRAGQPWTSEEDEQLALAFDANASLQQMSIEHGRSRGAIRSRLIKLGRLVVVGTNSEPTGLSEEDDGGFIIDGMCGTFSGHTDQS